MAFAATANRALGAALIVFLWGLLVFASTRGPFTALASVLLSALLGVVAFELSYTLLRGIGRAGFRLQPRHALVGGCLLLLFLCCAAGFWALFQAQILLAVVSASLYALARPAGLSGLRRLAGVGIGSLQRPPAYEVDPEGVTLDLGVEWSKEPERGSRVRLDFSELDEVRPLPAADPDTGASSLPTLLDGLRRWREMTYYVLGESERPHAWLQVEGGQGVLLRGPDLNYSLTFATQNGADLVEAFQAYRRQHPGPAISAPVPSGGGSGFAIFPAGEQANLPRVLGVTVACVLLGLGGLALAVLAYARFTSGGFEININS
ncbi:MAG TPA: hypothetical protein VK131_14380 [Candidatus Acidoferrales bacterium]|nr:hypothetical protein [Candidatus Acidoferrales bacterium]